MLQENTLKEAPRLNKTIVRAYQTLAGEFCIVNGEFSDLRCLMNTLHYIITRLLLTNNKLKYQDRVVFVHWADYTTIILFSGPTLHVKDVLSN